MNKFTWIVILSLTVLFYLISCSDDKSSTKPAPDTVLKVVVKGKVITGTETDTVTVFNSNVVVYQAETNQAVIRDLTNDDGESYFVLDQGNYYLQVTAQGFDPSPAPNVTPVPFYVSNQDTTVQIRYLNVNEITNAGYIEGKVEPAVSNVLIIAENTADQNRYSGVSGPDGYFVVYNLPLGSYNIEALKAGYKQSAAVASTIDVSTPQDSVAVLLENYAGSSLSGSLSFLATNDTLDVDIVLRDPKTKAVIPGLVTNEISASYSLDSIPDGDFIAWASFKNDGYVMDPDWIFKNPGALDVSFPASNVTLNFSLTGSVKIVSPSNPADSIYAFMSDSINSSLPIFRWLAYSSAKEYIIEVRDINGNILWGGFDENGVVRHQQILKENLSIQYNYDGSASANLVPGEIYQWKIYADDDTALNVQTLISSSEDLRGLFQVPLPAVK